MNAKNRAKKIYHKKSFDLLLREVVSNSIHSCAIKDQEKHTIKISIKLEDKLCEITIEDDGVGFDSKNFGYFTRYDCINEDKAEKGIKSLGQGRLSLLYFANQTTYKSIYKEEEEYYKRTFEYPFRDDLFEKDFKGITNDNEKQEKTVTNINIIKDNLKRAKKFFKDKKISDLVAYFENDFFPLLDKITLQIEYNGEIEDASMHNKKEMQKFKLEFDNKELELEFDNEELDCKQYTFTLYILNELKNEKGIINCFAKGLKCKIGNNLSLKYELFKDKVYYLTSELFDELINDTGDKIKLEQNDFEKIQNKITEILDKKFEDQVKENKEKNKEKIEEFKTKYPSFGMFMGSEQDCNKEITDQELRKLAIDTKSKAELDYWNNVDSEYEDKIIKSSLFNYFKHREKILNIFENDFLEHKDQEGDKKNQNESTIHDIIFKRKNEIKSNQDYFQHNLWLIDDKLSLFISAKSTVNGEKASDIYIYRDNNPNEIVIIELKSSHNAHNNQETDMIKKIINYACDVYNQKNGFLKGSVNDTEKCRYTAYIIASKEDIDKLYQNATNSSVVLKPITFLKNSYYIDSKFLPGKSSGEKDIHIQIITYKDLYTLAYNRNKPIIDLMYQGKK